MGSDSVDRPRCALSRHHWPSMAGDCRAGHSSRTRGLGLVLGYAVGVQRIELTAHAVDYESLRKGATDDSRIGNSNIRGGGDSDSVCEQAESNARGATRKSSRERGRADSRTQENLLV